LGISEAELGINLVGAKEMARVNRQFLQHEGSTDVITFDHRQSAVGNRQSAMRIHGELYICVDDAVAQAKEFETSWQSEIVRYAVHGVLHLLGHDDLTPALRRKMKRGKPAGAPARTEISDRRTLGRVFKLRTERGSVTRSRFAGQKVYE
jgi:rRNA maturation RNase YbeY